MYQGFMFNKFKFYIFFLLMANFLIPANALLLCKTFSWSYDTGGVASPSSGWGHVYTWSTPVITIPYCATYQITMNQWSGDNDGEWWHQKTTTYTVTLGAGTQVYANGQVLQVTMNQCSAQYPCNWYVNTQLIVGGAQVASLSDSGNNNTGAKDTDIDRGFLQVIVTRI
jgi:hypothetical protein